MSKLILDACCGIKAFWFDKNNPNVLFHDNRIREKGFCDFRPNREVKPDVQGDFRDLKFPDKSFKMVVMDPPHLFSKGETFRMVKAYGWLNRDTWKDDINKGFNECWRVLGDYGTLIFKWNESSVKVGEVLKVIDQKPLFGHTTAKGITIWLCFMKIPSKQEEAGL